MTLFERICGFVQKVSQTIRLTLLHALSSRNLSPDFRAFAESFDQVTVCFHASSNWSG
jgi:hypothetical protein